MTDVLDRLARFLPKQAETPAPTPTPEAIEKDERWDSIVYRGQSKAAGKLADATEPGERAKLLSQAFRDLLPGVSEEAITAAWATYSTPSAVVLAFFMHPHDGAVDFFERDVVPLEELVAAGSDRVAAFVRQCRKYDLADRISDVLEDEDENTVLRLIADGFSKGSAVHTALLQAIR